MRRVLFQVHRWVGLAAGVYVVSIAVTGAVLVFRIDLQRALHPHLFTPKANGALADPVTIMNSVVRAYPEHRLSGVDAPTTSRPTYLAYVASGAQFKTVLIDPVSAEVLGALPEQSIVRALQNLHFDLLGGRTGRTINGIGAGSILLLGLTGIGIWWLGIRLKPDTAAARVHRAVGISSVLLILMWAITGLHFAFPRQSRALIASVFPWSASRTPVSAPSSAAALQPSWQTMIDRARDVHPVGHIARVVLPFGGRDAFLVMFADASPTPAYAELDSVYLDSYTGELLPNEIAKRTIGDAIVRSMTTLHIGAFGGAPIRGIWFVFGLMPALLFGTGLVVWWNRTRRRPSPEGAEAGPSDWLPRVEGP